MILRNIFAPEILEKKFNRDNYIITRSRCLTYPLFLFLRRIGERCVCFIQELDECSVARASPTMRTLSNTPTAYVFTKLFIYRKSHFLELCICWQILADHHEICNSAGFPAVTLGAVLIPLTKTCAQCAKQKLDKELYRFKQAMH